MRAFTRGFRWMGAVTLAVLLGTAGAARADEALRRVQAELRDQGFYYGPVDGTPGDETTQALRRYQIRNGLAVSGQLNDETRRSLDRNSAANSTPPPLGTPAPAPAPRRSAPTYVPTPAPAPVYRTPPPTNRAQPDGDEQPDDAPAAPAPRAPGSYRPDLRVSPGTGGSYAVPPEGIAPSAALSALFASTPYEFAPPPVQADVLRHAQAFLGRNGFYDGRADGVPGPSTAEALTNFQEVNRLRRTGRLDVSTLGTMRLLPGRQTVGPRREGDPRQGPNIIFQGRVVD